MALAGSGGWLEGWPRPANSDFTSSADYWESRYAVGGTSGYGSYGPASEVKAAIINEFVQTRRVETVLELGCGDGNQLSLAEYPHYTGLDISPTAIGRCRERFANDPSKGFLVYDPGTFDEEYPDVKADLGLSLEVILHLIEDDVFERYMTHLFARSRRYVLIYGEDVEAPSAWAHVRRRPFTPWISEHAPTWYLESFIENPGRLHKVDVGMRSDFFIYARSADA